MSVAIEGHFPNNTAHSQALAQNAPTLEVPRLLEYRAEADPDAEFIPKTIAGFCGGMALLGTCLICAEVFWIAPIRGQDPTQALAMRFAFMIGIIGVAMSLLLVGLKVRADHTDHDLFARHWLNSIATGALYALIIWGPWLYFYKGLVINRGLAAAVFMLVMMFPLGAAMWVIGPHPTKYQTPH